MTGAAGGGAGTAGLGRERYGGLRAVVLSSLDPAVFVGAYPNDQLVGGRLADEGYRLAFTTTGSIPGCTYSLWAFAR